MSVQWQKVRIDSGNGDKRLHEPIKTQFIGSPGPNELTIEIISVYEQWDGFEVHIFRGLFFFSEKTITE